MSPVSVKGPVPDGAAILVAPGTSPTRVRTAGRDQQREDHEADAPRPEGSRPQSLVIATVLSMDRISVGRSGGGELRKHASSSYQLLGQDRSMMTVTEFPPTRRHSPDDPPTAILAR
jgi:hypothetical protein